MVGFTGGELIEIDLSVLVISFKNLYQLQNPKRNFLKPFTNDYNYAKNPLLI